MSKSTMEKDRFLEIEFQALRTEIENAKSRAFKIYGIGGLVVPILSGLGQVTAKEYDLTKILNLFLPFLVLGACILYLAERRAIIRCGKYIRKIIETNIEKNTDTIIGWESWLNRKATGQPTFYATISFYIVFFCYYVFTVLLALQPIPEKYIGFLIFFYSLTGFFVAKILWYENFLKDRISKKGKEVIEDDQNLITIKHPDKDIFHSIGVCWQGRCIVVTYSYDNNLITHKKIRKATKNEKSQYDNKKNQQDVTVDHKNNTFSTLIKFKHYCLKKFGFEHDFSEGVMGKKDRDQ